MTSHRPHPEPRASIALVLAGLAALTLAGACRGPATEQPGDQADARTIPDGVVCTADFRYGLNMTVVDSASGARVPAPMLIVASEGTYADTSDAARRADNGIGFDSWPLVGERAGTYTVRVVAPGYAEWRQDGVRITRDVCHVIPVKLTARLRKAP